MNKTLDFRVCDFLKRCVLFTLVHLLMHLSLDSIKIICGTKIMKQLQANWSNFAWSIGQEDTGGPFHQNFNFILRRDHQKNFLWASRLWVGRRKEPML